ncbi:DUF5667 domain-containing protein [Paenibacillus sp. GCM10023248]|uniref:DUF5667 domain-containing protein n=1 Tax=unclassified Paenibacillus TaxID=185978 RepID=UPI002379A844|nr:DUF5667 domain-containing protein [Paenibacillus sp. MAHUQ-63]MDD9271569.1 DUF5667 domain-containing protein [Paenibacillus sp. MAHUQ-63]
MKYNFITKSAMLSLLVFSVGTSSVFASEMPTPTPSSTPASVSVTENKTETTSLLPGDFFYFVKTMYENIRLALTVNDINEARLLTSYAQERLGEANSLFAKGKTNEASLSLQKSLETQQNAIQKTEQASGLSISETSAPAASATPSVNTETATAATDQTETKIENDSEIEVKHPEKVLKVKTDLQHNILALASALEKVGNPKAQSALMKNIEKSFDHLDKKLSKIEKKTQQGQTIKVVTDQADKDEPQPVASWVPSAVPSPSPVPSPATSQVRNDAVVSIQVKQDDSVEEQADHMKKGKDNKDKNRSTQEKEKKNNNQHGGSWNEHGRGNDKNKGNKQE